MAFDDENQIDPGVVTRLALGPQLEESMGCHPARGIDVDI